MCIKYIISFNAYNNSINTVIPILQIQELRREQLYNLLKATVIEKIFN